MRISLSRLIYKDKLIMKNIVLLVLIIICIKGQQKIANQSTVSVSNQSTQAIVLNVQKNTTSDHHVSDTHQLNLNKSANQSFSTLQGKEPTFDFGSVDHKQANFQKQLQNIQSAPKQWEPNPELAQQTQRESEIQIQKHEEQVESQQSHLKTWIAEEIQNFEQQVQGIVTQSFQFILDPGLSYMVRWNPPKTQQLRLSILVFQVLDNGQIMLEQDLEQDQFIKVQSRQEGQTHYNLLGKAYVSKVFHINFDTDYKYFRFVSSLPRSVFVVIDLQKLHEVIPENVAKDKHFLLPLSKLKSIQEQIESGEKIREHTYKYQWGFLDNQYTHDSRLLGLTAFQLLIIIGSAIAQLYFIKNLLDNRAIV